jgi:hypothetical protein
MLAQAHPHIYTQAHSMVVLQVVKDITGQWFSAIGHSGRPLLPALWNE